MGDWRAESLASPSCSTRPRGAAAFEIRRLDRVGQPLARGPSSSLELQCDRRPPAASGGRASVAGSTSSNATARPSTSSRAKPLRRRLAIVAATAPSSVGRARRSEPSRIAPTDALGASAPHRRLVRRLGQLVDFRRVAARRGDVDDRQVEADQQPRAGGSSPSCARDDLRRLAHDFLAAVAAEGAADAREQQPHVVVDLGRRADRRARIADAVLLPDRDRRRDAVDAIDVRLLHPLEELPRVGRQRLDVAALPFGVDRVEGERRLARSADAGDDDQLADGQRRGRYS